MELDYYHPEMEWASFSASCCTIEDLGCWEIGKFQESAWNDWNWWQVPRQNVQKSAIKHSIEKSNLLNSVNCYIKFSPRLRVKLNFCG